MRKVDRIERKASDVIISPETGERLVHGVRPFEVAYKGASLTVDLPGWYPAGDGEGVHVGEDMNVVDEALRELKRRVDGVPTPAEIRALRRKLKLSQAAAGELLKVGAKAFDKYERGLVAPSGPTVQLMVLLGRHPELADDLVR
jgi:HTH-type transcriptional regulator / antitoxin MqsA